MHSGVGSEVRSGRALILFLALAAASCATPVGVTKVSREEASRTRTASALTTGMPSAASAQFIYRLDLVGRAKSDPEGVLSVLHDGLGKADEPDRLMALAELSLIYATNSGDRSYDLAAAVYAWAFLFPTDGTRPTRYDPRVALAIDIYNQGIAVGLGQKKGDVEFVNLSSRAIDLPFATLYLESESAGFRQGETQLTDFISLADFKVRGLRNRYQQQGIGAALVGKPTLTGNTRFDRWLPPRSDVPITVVLRFDHPRQGMTDGSLRGTIELYDAEADPDIQIDGDNVPLETDNTAALAYRLEDSPLWDFAIAGFRRGEINSFFEKKSTALSQHTGLFMVQPYTSGRIPIVFVHGTASSPLRWAQMLNEIMGDPRLAQKYQCWYFLYTTGSPIAYSALRLREALELAVKDVDPEGRDLALRRMVVIGHSQGGLLTKMLMVNSGNLFWANISKLPFDQAKLTPETRDLLRRALFLKPLQYVKRGIFIATPHHGSFLADNFFGNLARRFISLPGNLLSMGSDISRLGGRDPLITRFPTSVDNMKPSNPFLKTLASLPIAPGLYANSIIAVKGDGPAAEGDDGVLTYRSAHIDGVESELVVRTKHSTQAAPSTIEEVRRILYLHLEES